MDTINVTIKLEKQLTMEQQKVFFSGEVKSWIFKFKEVTSQMTRAQNTYTFSLSFPRFYDKETNAYLVTKQSEVDLVIQTLTDLIELELGNKIISAVVTRVDYPFTFLMDEGRDYNSYRGIFEILARASKITTVKNIEEMRKRKKETHIFSSSRDSTKRVNKIMVYNQFKKIKDKYSRLYLKIQKRYPELEKRMRIEISLKTDIKLKKLRLKKIKSKTYEYIIEHLFDEKLIEQFLIQEVLRLTKALQKEKELNNRVYVESFILRENPVSYEVMREVVKRVYLSTRSKENFMKNTRIAFREREEREHVVYFKIMDEIRKIKKSLKKEKMRSTK